MSSYALMTEERAWFVDFLRGLHDEQWNAGTVCEGWSIEDLAGHLVVRERRMLTAGWTIVIPAFHQRHLRAIRAETAKGRERLVDLLASGPPLARLVAPMNVMEYWVHNEDALRGDLGQRRDPPGGELRDWLWRQCRRFARFNLIRFPQRAVIAFAAPGLDGFALRVGRPFVTRADPDEADVIVTGEPGEILLWLTGRGAVADLDLLVKDPRVGDALGSARLGL